MNMNIKKSNIILSLILVLFLNQGLIKAITIQPVERSVGRLNISIDPRMELLAAIHSLSNNDDLANRNLSYTKEILSYFEAFSSQESVKLTENLRQQYGFGFDAPVAFMLHLSQPAELEEKVKFSDYILGRSGGDDNLEQYRKAIKQFAEVSNFEEFWNSKIPFYNQILDLTIENMGEIDLVETMENYFNETQDIYCVIITPAFQGGKGAFVAGADRKENFYATVPATNTIDGIPFLNENDLRFYIWHEYGHFFVNPLTEKYLERVMALDILFEPIKEVMARQAYGCWNSTVNEHIIRAVEVRLWELHLGSQQANERLNMEFGNRFIYIEPLVEKLKDFEKQRDENNITFAKFFPELLDVLDSLLKIEYWKQVNPNHFRGPIGNVLKEEKTVIIYPTQDLDIEALEIAQGYAFRIFEGFLKPKYLMI